METRLILMIILMSLSIIDLLATYFYIKKYKKWQPNKPYELIENNPLLRFLMNKLGTDWGMIIGGTIILVLITLLALTVHFVILGILMAILLFTIINHINNFNLLNKLIKFYPDGHLPENTFGKVEGNNKYKRAKDNLDYEQEEK